MTQKLPADQQMTDVFGRFQNSAPSLSAPSGPVINNRKKNILGTAAVLLTGGAAFAAINFDEIRTYVEEKVKELSTDEVPAASEGTLTTEAPAKVPSTERQTIPLQHYTSSAVQNGTITPTDKIEIAGQVREDMSFPEAYAAAREEVGPGGIFSWHGQVYNTYTVEEWRELSLSQRQEFLSDVGYQPAQSTETVEPEPTTIADTVTGQGEAGKVPPIADNLVNGGNETIAAEPDYYDLFINGRPALGIDDDHDGIADAIVFLDEDSNTLLAFVDLEGDARIDTVIQFDTTSQQVIGQEALAEPFLAEISELKVLSEQPESGSNIALVAALEEDTSAYNDDNDYTYDDNGYVNDAELPEMD